MRATQVGGTFNNNNNNNSCALFALRRPLMSALHLEFRFFLCLLLLHLNFIFRMLSFEYFVSFEEIQRRGEAKKELFN